jgi:6-phosphogluconolactonase
VYVGTYTNGGASKGIYLTQLDLASGQLEPAIVAAEIANPGFLAIHPRQRFLYAVGELSKKGAVSALAIEPKTGKLKLLNQQLSRGNGPCHVVVDKSGRNVIVSNYNSGSIACLPVLPDGRLGEADSFFQHKGSSVDRQRQEAAHAHSTNLDAANHFAFTPDLGLDKIMIYRFDMAGGRLSPNEPAFTTLPPGSGPRHFAFHPGGRYAYVINELKSTVTAFAYNASRGTLQAIQTLSTLPDDFGGKSTAAEIQVHPSGKFLYGSNRGHDSIAAFAIDPDTGKLRSLGREPTQGKTPRNFAIDPTGAFLIAANQDSGNLVAFRIDAKTGLLKATGNTISVSCPVCVKMMKPLL